MKILQSNRLKALLAPMCSPNALRDIAPKHSARHVLMIVCAVLGMQSAVQVDTKRTLFIGNSYTQVNNLPQMVADVAQSAGNELQYDVNAPGGFTFQMHASNAITQEKIANGMWDYVVLQEQSQLPSFPIQQVEMEVFPYASDL